MMRKTSGPKEKKERRGSLILGTCDRAGHVELFTKEGRSVILPTICKTWGCVVCSRKLIGVFKAKVEVGVSRLGACGFITITYQAERDEPITAQCASRDWQALWQKLRRSGYRFQWLKVTELTEKGIPHHHVAVGPWPGRIRCHGRKIKRGRQTARYVSRIPTCDCLAHVFARAWQVVTGDSYMVFAVPVFDAKGAGGYMAKYMAKRCRGTQTGRRYSTSRGWPGGKRPRLEVTLRGGWDHIRMWPAGAFDSYQDWNPQEQDLLGRVGDADVVAILERHKVAAKRKQIERLRRV